MHGTSATKNPKNFHHLSRGLLLDNNVLGIHASNLLIIVFESDRKAVVRVNVNAIVQDTRQFLKLDASCQSRGIILQLTVLEDFASFDIVQNAQSWDLPPCAFVANNRLGVFHDGDVD